MRILLVESQALRQAMELRMSRLSAALTAPLPLPDHPCSSSLCHSHDQLPGRLFSGQEGIVAASASAAATTIPPHPPPPPPLPLPPPQPPPSSTTPFTSIASDPCSVFFDMKNYASAYNQPGQCSLLPHPTVPGPSSHSFGGNLSPACPIIAPLFGITTGSLAAVATRLPTFNASSVNNSKSRPSRLSSTLPVSVPAATQKAGDMGQTAVEHFAISTVNDKPPVRRESRFDRPTASSAGDNFG
ncbi:unnamed protein product, partial [Protopolystoma xenopodis]